MAFAILASACAGKPARLVAGKADTVLVNSLRQVVLPLRALDGSGREVQVKDVRYEWISGDSMRVSTNGRVTCSKRGDTKLRATLGSLTTEFLLLCRPVKGFRFFMAPPLYAGGPAHELALGAVGVDDMPVTLLAGTATIADSEIAALRGLTVLPRKPGETTVVVDIGDCVQGIYIEVDEHVTTSLDLAGRNQVFTVSPLRLVSGEIRSWPLRRGDYVLWLRPIPEQSKQLVLGGVSVNCVSWPDVGQKYHCLAFDNAAVVVRNTQPAGSKELVGELSVKRMDLVPVQATAPARRQVDRSVRRGKPFCRVLR